MPTPKPNTRRPARDHSVEEFFEDSWAIYARVLDNNYMGHDDIYRNVQQFIADRHAGRPFSLLDLGCGSARHLAGILEGLYISRYLGYDISLVALEHARRNVAGLNGPVELRQGDLLDAIRTESDTFDIVFSSFAVHHLQADEKADFFRLAADRLAADGVLILIDVMREEDEDRATYLDRYCHWMASDWTALSPAALTEVCAHIRESDFPETFSQVRRMAADAGFGSVIEMPRYRFHHTLVLQHAKPYGSVHAYTRKPGDGSI